MRRAMAAKIRKYEESDPMKLVLKSKPKRRPNPSRRKNGKVFRFLKRLDNGDLLLFGFVPRYKKDYGKNGGDRLAS